MNVRIVTKPVRLVTLADVKEDFNILHADSDAKITRLIAEAEAAVSLRAGRALGLGKYEAAFPGFPACGDLTLPLPPLRADAGHPVVVKYVDGDGVTQTLDPAGIRLVGSGYKHPARIALAFNANGWPATRALDDAVLVEFWAGYDPDDELAGPLREAIRMYVQMNYENYEGARRELWQKALDDALASYWNYSR